MQSENEKWYNNIPNIHKIKEKDLQFIFAQSEKALDDSIKNFDSTTNKSINVVAVIVALLSTLIGYFSINFSIRGTFDIILSATFIIIVYLFYPAFLISKNILSTGYYTIGSNPETLISNSIFSNENINSKVESTTMILSEIISYNKRINTNIEINSKRIVYLDRTVKALLYLPAIGIITYAFLVLISFLLF